MLLVHAQGVEIFFPLFVTRRLMNTQCRLVIVEIVFSLDRLTVPRVLRAECGPRAKPDTYEDRKDDDDGFDTHGVLQQDTM